MFKLTSKLVMTMLVLFGFTTFVSCEKEKAIPEQKVSTNTSEVFRITASENGNRSKNASDFCIDLRKENENDNFVKGSMNMAGMNMNVKMNLSDDMFEGSEIVYKNDSELQIMNLNGYDYTIYVENYDEQNAKLSFLVNDEQIDVNVSGNIDVNSFFDLKATTSERNIRSANFVCGGACVAIVASVLTGAYCAYQISSLSDDCKEAYQTAIEAGNTCSYEFEASACGGDCDVTCE